MSMVHICLRWCKRALCVRSLGRFLSNLASASHQLHLNSCLVAYSTSRRRVFLNVSMLLYRVAITAGDLAGQQRLNVRFRKAMPPKTPVKTPRKALPECPWTNEHVAVPGAVFKTPSKECECGAACATDPMAAGHCAEIHNSLVSLDRCQQMAFRSCWKAKDVVQRVKAQAATLFCPRPSPLTDHGVVTGWNGTSADSVDVRFKDGSR